LSVIYSKDSETNMLPEVVR